jgi:hypothetical protein
MWHCVSHFMACLSFRFLLHAAWILHSPRSIGREWEATLQILKLNLNGESNYLPKTFAGEYAHPNHCFRRGHIMYADYFWC